MLDDVRALRDLYCPETQCYNGGQLRLEMIRRGVSVPDLVLKTGRVRSTIMKAMAGQKISDTTASAIWKVLSASPPAPIEVAV